MARAPDYTPEQWRALAAKHPTATADELGHLAGKTRQAAQRAARLHGFKVQPCRKMPTDNEWRIAILTQRSAVRLARDLKVSERSVHEAAQRLGLRLGWERTPRIARRRAAVAGLVGAGLTTKQIARHLGCTHWVVSGDRKHLKALGKLPTPYRKPKPGPKPATSAQSENNVPASTPATIMEMMAAQAAKDNAAMRRGWGVSA